MDFPFTFDPFQRIANKYKKELIAVSHIPKSERIKLSSGLLIMDSGLSILRDMKLEELSDTGLALLMDYKRKELGLSIEQEVVITQEDVSDYFKQLIPPPELLSRFKKLVDPILDYHLPVFRVISIIMQRQAWESIYPFMDHQPMGLTSKEIFLILRNQSAAIAERIIRSMAHGETLELLLDSFEKNDRKRFIDALSRGEIDFTGINKYAACSCLHMYNYIHHKPFPDIEKMQEINSEETRAFIARSQAISQTFKIAGLDKMINIGKELTDAEHTAESVLNLFSSIKQCIEEVLSEGENSNGYVDTLYGIITTEATRDEKEVLLEILSRPENSIFCSQYESYCESLINTRDKEEMIADERTSIPSEFVSLDEFRAMQQCEDRNLFLERSIAKCPWMTKSDIVKSNTPAEEYDMVVKVYNALGNKMIIPKCPEDFEIFLFRMTGKHKADKNPIAFRKNTLNLPSSNFYCLIKNLTRPVNPSRGTVEEGVFEKAYAIFDWNDKPLEYNKSNASKYANKGKAWYARELACSLGDFYST